MPRISLSLSFAATSLVLALQAAPAHAQASRTWVSGVGDDANPCSRTAPCKTFAGAISKTALNGEINCLDPGGFGAVTITKSITIDCHEVFASILNSGTNGVNVPFDSFNAADVRKTVRLRNINFNGVNTGIIGVRITGGAVIAAGVVIIEDCLIDGNFAGAARGISDERTGGGELYVSNTTIRNTGGNGILINPGNGAVAGQRIDSTFDNIRITNSVLGLGIASNGRAVINRSVFSGNTNAGIVANGALAATEVNVTNSVSSNNGIGVQNGGGTVTIRLSNSDIAFNGTANPRRHAILHQQPDHRKHRGRHRPDPDRCDHQPDRVSSSAIPQPHARNCREMPVLRGGRVAHVFARSAIDAHRHALSAGARHRSGRYLRRGVTRRCAAPCRRRRRGGCCRTGPRRLAACRRRRAPGRTRACRGCAAACSSRLGSRPARMSA